MHLLHIIIYSDDRNVGNIKVHRDYIRELATKNGLTEFLEDSLGYYACVDGAVLVMWGYAGKQPKIIGLTVKPDILNPDSALRQAWEEHKGKHLTIRDVHRAVLEATNQVLN